MPSPLPSSRQLAARSALVAFGLLALAPDFAAAAGAAATADETVLHLAPTIGHLGLAADGESLSEELELAAGLADRLLAVPDEATVRIADWPIAPGERATVEVRSFDVYAPDARIYEVRGRQVRELPRSALRFFGGTDLGDPDRRVQLAVDPISLTLSAVSFSLDGPVELRLAEPTTGGAASPWGAPASAHARAQRSSTSQPSAGADRAAGDEDHRPRSYVLAPSQSFAPAADGTPGELEFTCAERDLAARGLAPRTPPVESASPTWIAAVGAAALPSLHSATIAVDTDNELLLKKFADDTGLATNYLAQLFAALNVAYERDLNIRLLQGTTFLRTSGTADPYPSTTSTSTYDQLLEFGNYWNANHSGVSRALAMMLSGKASSGNSAAGIAWIGVVCNGSSGYSFTRVFWNPVLTAASDARIVAHELGHNFGSPHTHCYSPPIDSCYAGESGCYSGATACPAATTINGVANVRGTVMSYCHNLGGCGASTVFHARTVDVITGHVTPRINSCVFPVTPPAPTVTAVSPLQGGTAGGTAVTISGTNFRAGAGVTFGGAAATSVVVVNATTITAVTPARSTGAVTVTVTNSDTTTGSRANGFFYANPAAAADFYTVTPCRILDTRNPNGALGGPALGAGATRTFVITGSCGVPADAVAVSLNVTTVNPTAVGSIIAFPGNAFPLGTSTAAYSAGLNRANNATLRLATNGAGSLGFYNSGAGSVHLVLDVNGYYR